MAGLTAEANHVRNTWLDHAPSHLSRRDVEAPRPGRGSQGPPPHEIQGQSDLTPPLQMCLLCCHLSWAPGHLGESEWIVRWESPIRMFHTPPGRAFRPLVAIGQGPDRDIEYEGRWQWQQPTGGSMNQSKMPEATAGPAFLSSIHQASIRTPGGGGRPSGLAFVPSPLLPAVYSAERGLWPSLRCCPS